MSPQSLQRLRKQAGMSQRELSDALGCSFQLVSKMESGDRAISDEARAKLADIFGVESGDILQGKSGVMEDREQYTVDIMKYVPTDALIEAHAKAVEGRDWETAERLAGILKNRKG